MRGAVIGFGQRAPHSKNAVSISFGDTGYAPALGRVFGRVSYENVLTTTSYTINPFR